MKRIPTVALFLGLFPLAPTTFAGDVPVRITGTVFSNSISSGPFAGASAGQPFSLDFEVFTPGVDLSPNNLVLYNIDLPTFVLDVNGAQMGPATSGTVPTFCIQESFPVTDGAIIDPSQLAVPGHTIRYTMSNSDGSIFNSTDINQVLGTYDAANFPIGVLFLTVTGPGGTLDMIPDILTMGATDPFPSFCNGDGGDQLGCTDCPCGNNATAGTIGGCTNSAGTSTRILPSGTAPISAADLRVEASGAPPSNSCVLTSGNGQAPANAANPCFGLNSGVQSVSLDGLRCAVQGVLRHGVRPSDGNGDVGVTTNGWGPPNGFFNFGAFTSGTTKHLQIIHRDNAAVVCMTGQNTSNGVSVTFTP